jgi:hypothetical protein
MLLPCRRDQSMSLPPVTRPHNGHRTAPRPAAAARSPVNHPEVLAMKALVLDMSVSLDGFVTGPRPRADEMLPPHVC